MIVGDIGNNSSKSKIKANNKYVNFEFTLFVHISLIVIIINITTAILIPQNASWIISLSNTLTKILANIIIEKKDGVIIPKIAAIAPSDFLTLYPANMEILPAIIPGIHWLRAKKSTNSSSLNQFLYSTMYLFNNGNITYPPPKSWIPIRKNILNISNNDTFFI